MKSLVIFLLLHFLLYLPRFLFHQQSNRFLPLGDWFSNGTFYPKALLSRINHDPFRINLELCFMLLVVAVFKGGHGSIPLIFTLSYLIILVLSSYHYGILSIFKTHPAIRADRRLLAQGFQIVWQSYRTTLIISLFLAAFFVYFLYQTFHFLFTNIHASSNDKWLILIASSTALALGVIFYFHKKVNPFVFRKENDSEILANATFQSVIHILSANCFFSRRIERELAALPDIAASSFYPNSPLAPTIRPNLCFIALESYGAILYENPSYRESYLQSMMSFQQNCDVSGWHTAGNLFQSPVSGGGSWMAFSSLLKGTNIASDSIYQRLLHQQPQFPSQSIMDIFNDWGYETFLVAGIGGFENVTFPWKNLLSFMGTKHLIRFKDLDYQGLRFNIGPSAPDQFLLNRSLEIIRKRTTHQPFAMFVETTNSHVKFHSPTVVFDDWRFCQQATHSDYQSTTVNHAQLQQNYLSAIGYQLSNIEQLIRNSPMDTLFVIFGDHQPALISTVENSFRTPLHLISADPELIVHFTKHGFTPGMIYDENSAQVPHFASFKNVFLDAFTHHNGS